MSTGAIALVSCGLTMISVLLFLCYLLIRNSYVYKYRIKTINTSPEEYNNLPSYDKMLWQLFRFDWSDYHENISLVYRKGKQ